MRENLHCDCALSQRKYSIYSQGRTQVKAVHVGIKKNNHNLLQFHHLFGRSWGRGNAYVRGQGFKCLGIKQTGKLAHILSVIVSEIKSMVITQ